MECPLCGGYRSARHKLCKKCAAQYGQKSSQWPRWLKALRAITANYWRKPGGITGAPKDIQIVSYLGE